MATVETSSGSFSIRLHEAKAPKLVANFVALARGKQAFQDPKDRSRWVKRPFYDGLSVFGRKPDFVVQFGCPRGDGRGEPGYTLPRPEASVPHDAAGTVSMVGFDDRLSGSQLFIALKPQPHLDAQHRVFGQVTQGLEVVFQLAEAKDTPTVKSVRIHRQ